MAINKAIVIGNLGANPQVRTLPKSGDRVANFSVATKERFTDRNGDKQERTEWHRDRGLRAHRGYLRAILEQGPSGLRRRQAYHPPVRSQGRKREAVQHRNHRAATPRAWESRRCGQDGCAGSFGQRPF